MIPEEETCTKKDWLDSCQGADEYHSCPYAEEVYENYSDSYCKCCKACQEECRQST